LTGPFLTARLFCHRLHHLLIWTPALGIFSCVVGVALSRSILSGGSVALSTSGLISTVIGVIFALAIGIKKIIRLSFRRKSLHTTSPLC
jgi:manganese/zinc/iron transport system permease protein